jgi:hypothetical protein
VDTLKKKMFCIAINLRNFVDRQCLNPCLPLSLNGCVWQ